MSLVIIAIVLAYLVVALLAFRASIRFGKNDSEYDWDETDATDMAALGAISLFVGLFWPLCIIAAIGLQTVRRIYRGA
jgi:hypothetical protein